MLPISQLHGLFPASLIFFTSLVNLTGHNADYKFHSGELL